jgi:hypothetical protein
MSLDRQLPCLLVAALLLAPSGIAGAQSLILPEPSDQARSTPTQQAPPSAIERAAAALRSSPVYVDEDAERAISPADAARIRERLARAGAGPLYIAILPRAVADAAGASPDRALALLAERVAEPGTYVAFIGGSLRAGATGGILERGTAGSLVRQSLGEHADEGTVPVLLDLVDRIGDARSAGGGDVGESDDGSGVTLVLGLFGLGAVAVAASRWRRRRREQAQLAEV